MEPGHSGSERSGSGETGTQRFRTERIGRNRDTAVQNGADREKPGHSGSERNGSGEDQRCGVDESVLSDDRDASYLSPNKRRGSQLEPIEDQPVEQEPLLVLFGAPIGGVVNRDR